MILVRKDLQQRLLHKQAHGSAQVAIMEAQGWVIWSAYAALEVNKSCSTFSLVGAGSGSFGR